MKKQLLTLLSFLLVTLIFTSCGDDDAPAAENEEEVIDKVTLTFFPPTGGGAAVVQTATDPDGEGPASLAPDGAISLADSTTYTLFLKFEFTEEGEDITEEIEEEDDEHMVFFAFTDGIFSDPSGDGNVDARADDINYEDFDDNQDPLGLETTWTTGAASSSNTFRVLLKHQPGEKSATSSSTDGETDVDITWTLNIN